MKPSLKAITHRVADLVIRERDRQYEKHGDQSDLSMVDYHAILAEEYGEFSKEVVEDRFARGPYNRANMLTEVIQTAAVAIAIAEILMVESDQAREEGEIAMCVVCDIWTGPAVPFEDVDRNDTAEGGPEGPPADAYEPSSC